MKKQFYFLILFTTVLIVTSCCPEKKYYHIKDKDKLRFNENDMLIYKSNLNNYDTLIIEEIIDDLDYYETSEGLCDTKFYIERITYFYNNLNNLYDVEKRPRLYLWYDMSNEKSVFNASFYKPTSVLTTTVDIGDYYLGYNIYKNTICKRTYNNIDSLYIKKYVYNKENGFIFYEYTDGEQFSLINYIPAK